MNGKKRFFLFFARSSGTATDAETKTATRRRGRCLRSLFAVAIVRCVVVVLVSKIEPYHHHEGVDGSTNRTIQGGDRHGRA